MTYTQAFARATATWQPLPGSHNLGYYTASGQVVFSTFTGYLGAKRLQDKLNALNTRRTR